MVGCVVADTGADSESGCWRVSDGAGEAECHGRPGAVARRTRGAVCSEHGERHERPSATPLVAPGRRTGGDTWPTSAAQFHDIVIVRQPRWRASLREARLPASLHTERSPTGRARSVDRGSETRWRG